MTLRQLVFAPLLCLDAHQKALLTRALDASAAVEATDELSEPLGIPGRPERPVLVPHNKIKQRSVNTVEGRAALIHAIAHIERNSPTSTGERKRNFVGQHFWARGYFVSTVGRDEAVIREYIKNQEKEDERLDQLGLWR